MANHPPGPPTNVAVGGQTYSTEMPTHALNQVNICATVSDADQGQRIRLVLQLSKDKNFKTYKTYRSDWEDWKQGGRRICVLPNDLDPNTLYYGRLLSQDKSGAFSQHPDTGKLNWKEVDFWTDRVPDPPTLVKPEDNSQFLDVVNFIFQWQFVDPDGENEKQQGYQIRYREVSPLGTALNQWTTLASKPTGNEGNAEQYPVSANDRTFKPNTSYQWSVRTRDQQGLWGDWALPFRFAIAGSTKAPILVSPINNVAVDVEDTVGFVWRYIDPRTPVEPQKYANIRWRVAGTTNWTTITGDPAEPGPNNYWEFAPGLFAPGLQYEWQVQTANATTLSDWSASAFFWSMRTPGSGSDIEPLPDNTSIPAPPLGCGQNRVYVYERGGQRLVGEILPCTGIQWSRKRDDISNAQVVTNGFGWDCGELLKNLRCFQHELVIFRDGVRVWEGPITRIAYHTDQVEIEARDVMTYVYRRIMRQGYNDSYQIAGQAVYNSAGKLIRGTQIGIRSVVERASILIQNALVYDDPNVLPYLTAIITSNDASEGRDVPAYSRTAWEEVDDLAATAGLDYVTVGRRIILWDTHQEIGILPEMRDGDFSDSPVVTEYGMNLANYFAVTNNSGIWGAVRAVDGGTANGKPPFYGWVEQLASAYGEAAGGGDTTTLTAAAQADLVTKLEAQAQRNIAARWPGPVIVRVPDNSTLNPEVNIGINQLIPGIHIPLRASNTLRPISQMQKLDSVTVTQDSTGEKVAVVMSPAPKAFEDFDADAAASEDD